MKATTLLFFVIIFLIAMKVFNVVQINTWIIIVGAVLWIIVFYWQTRQENRRNKIPRPVYIANPQ